MPNVDVYLCECVTEREREREREREKESSDSRCKHKDCLTGKHPRVIEDILLRGKLICIK
jgi:hypothetical protein